MDWWSKSHNWVSGCERVSPACDHCWVPNFLHTMTLDRGKFAGATTDSGTWSGQVQLLQSVLDRGDPLNWKPQWIFTNIMADTFHKDVPEWAIARQLALAAIADQHIWMLCTKRERRMHQLLNSDSLVREVGRQLEWWEQQPRVQKGLSAGRLRLPDKLEWPIPNLWCGVTLEANRYGFRVAKYLADTPAAVRFASCEPLMDGLDGVDCGQLDWMVVGGEDLHPDAEGYRPIHPDWARNLRDRCAEAGTAYWFKQWGSGYPVGQGSRTGKRYEDTTPTDRDLWVTPGGAASAEPTPGATQIRRMHKRAAGRLLDGQEIFQVPTGWEAHPAVVAHAAEHGVVIETP